MKKRFILIFLIFSIVVLALSFVFKNYQTNNSIKDGQKVISIKQGRFVYSIDLVGEIEAKKQIYIAANGHGAKIEMIDDDGTIVKKGDVITKLESKENEDELESKEMELGISKNELTLLEQNFSADMVKYASSVTLAEKDVQLQKLELKKLIDGATKEELDKLHLEIKLAQRALKFSKENLEQSNILFKKGFTQKKDILEKELDVAQKEKDLEIANAEYKITKDGNTETEKQIARLKLKQAENNLANAEKIKDLEIKKYKLEKEKQEVKIDANVSSVNKLKTLISDASIKAPVNGTVVLNKIFTDQGLAKPKVGDRVGRGMAFISVANLDDFNIKTEVPEQYIGKIKKGLPCNITISTLKGKKFKGNISKIGFFAKDKSNIFQQYSNYIEGESKVFELEIELLEKDALFKPGMSVDVHISLKDLNSVIVIPNKAIYKETSKNYVILENGEKRYIEISETNKDESVVKSGLNVGEKIIIESEEDNTAQGESI